MRALKYIGFAALGLVMLLAVVIAGAMGYRAYRQHENALALHISAPRGIEEAGFVNIGGLPQWLQIRGEDRDNPVLLFVHGGPAVSMIPFTFRSMRPWEQYFTVVEWDQRGAGRTYFRNGSADKTATGMQQIIDDGIQVSEYLRKRLGKRQIILMGESWGSAVALEMVRARPELFVAFVGTGQLVDMPRSEVLSYQWLLGQARAAHDEKTLGPLTQMGPPPYASEAVSLNEQELLGGYLGKIENQAVMANDLLFDPRYSLWDALSVISVAPRHRSVLVRDDEHYRARDRGVQFAVPMFFFQGTLDMQAPTQLVREYLNEITAPRKELILFPGGGHNAFVYFSEDFLKELVTRVRPLALASAVSH
ncbi:MAG TPA: alpha/beta hydrolase [Steroidobacteraceae bacterium]|nr:alpha/beta hydrolase [Steroidobacteraceae bacterium]